MKSKPLPEETRLRFEALELLVQGRRFVDQGVPVEEVAKAFDVSVEALQSVPPGGEMTVDIIADLLGVSHQYVSKVCEDAYAALRRKHPGLREELRAA